MMQERHVKIALDPMLHPLVAAGDDARADELLAGLMGDEAEPLIRQIVGYKLRAYAGQGAGDGEDVCSEVRVQLFARLAALRSAPDTQAIQNFRSYVAVTAYRACYEYLRRKYPQRYSLKQKLRNLLHQHAELALWESAEEEWVAGLSAWRRASGRLRLVERGAPGHRRLQELREDPRGFAQAALPRGTAQGMSLDALLAAIFRWAEQPIDLDDLVGIVAELQGIKDRADESFSSDEGRAATLESLPDARASVLDELAERRSLERLWNEVRQMSPRHCAALLLNLRDGEGGSAIDLLLFTGAAKFGQIAAAMGMTEEELARIWNHLPLDDRTIAKRLGVTRQQVINLRKSARERLHRRMSVIGY